MAYTKWRPNGPGGVDPWTDNVGQKAAAAFLSYLEQGVVDAAAVADNAIPKTIAGVATNKVPVFDGTNWVAQKITKDQIDPAAGILFSQLAMSAGAPTGTKFLRDDGAMATPPSQLPGYGTSLPASPTDGQEYILVDSLTSPTFQWRLRYNAGSLNTDKWESVGGGIPQTAFITASETTASATDVDLTTVGPSITIARSGVYIVGASYRVFEGGTGGGNASATIYDNTLTTGVSAVVNVSTIGGAAYDAFREYKLGIVVAAGHVLKLKYSISNSLSTSFGSRAIWAYPIRVS